MTHWNFTKYTVISVFEKLLRLIFFRGLFYFVMLLMTTNQRSFSQDCNDSGFVETLKIGMLAGPNGMMFDKLGNLIIANELGKSVIKVNSKGQSTIYLDSVLVDSPSGLDQCMNGDVVVSNFFSGRILKISLEGKISEIAQIAGHPGDIKADRVGNIYVSEYGDAGKSNGGQILRLRVDGTKDAFAEGFLKPFGLVFDKYQNLYVANNTTGEISKVDSAGKVYKFAQVPGSVSYLVYSTRTGKIYAPSYFANKIFVLSPNGEVHVLAGSGKKGSRDGNFLTSEFEGPNSAALNARGDLFVSEIGANRIRVLRNADR